MSRAPSVLLIGASGMLGRAFRAELERRRWPFLAPSRAELDLADPASTKRFRRGRFEAMPWLVVNCAAWTDVDGAEANEAGATAINGHAIGELVAIAAAVDGVLVNFGTDYVFSGVATAPYRTDQAREPINAYGRSKAVGEERLEREHMTRWLHVRTSWLYAPWGKNFVRTIRQLVWTRPSIRVVNDQRGRPTSAEHLARTTLRLLDAGARGILHVTDGGECTWYELACEIGRLSGAPGRVEPCTSAEFPRPARRPAYSVLDLTETERLVGPMPDWRANLADVMGRLES